MGLTKKQHEVFQYIKSYTLEKGYSPTQKEIKEHFQLKSFGSVQRYLKYLKDAGLLTTDWNAKRGLTLLEEEKKSTANENEYEIPLLGDVAAGNPIEAIENPSETIFIPTYLTPKKGQHFALRVCGESMIEDGILDGDIAILRQVQAASVGETIVAVVDGEATLKKFYQKKNVIELHPANKTMSPIKVTRDQDCKIVGKLIGLFRQY